MFCLKKIKFTRKRIDILIIVTVLALYSLNNIFFKNITSGIIHEFLVCHFNDLICPFFFLSYCNLLLNTQNKGISRLSTIIIVCALCGFVWEYIAPYLKHSSISDPIDFLCYVIGGTLYYFLLRRISD